MKKYYGCWLHLSKKDNEILSPIIAKISSKYASGDIFPPHISVNDAGFLEFNEVKKAALGCIKGISKFEVRAESIRHSDRWSKTLYIQIKNNHCLSKISKRLNKTFRIGKPPYLLNPHISLLYKEGLSKSKKKYLASNLKLPNKYLVSSIAVATTGNVKNWRDYGNWEIVFEKELG